MEAAFTRTLGQVLLNSCGIAFEPIYVKHIARVAQVLRVHSFERQGIDKPARTAVERDSSLPLTLCCLLAVAEAYWQWSTAIDRRSRRARSSALAVST